MIPNHPYYTGEGGYNGPPAFVGVPKPLCFGKCLRVQPICIDNDRQVWQYHGGAGYAKLTALYENGELINGDYDTWRIGYKGLFSVECDEYMKHFDVKIYLGSPDYGCFRLNYIPTGIILCDVDGPSYHYNPMMR